MDVFQQESSTVRRILKVVIVLGVIVSWADFELVITHRWPGMTDVSRFNAIIFLLMFPLPAVSLFLKRQDIVIMTLFMYILLSVAVRLNLA